MELRRLRHRDELQDIIKLQEKIWNNDIIPLHKLLSDLHNGGILLGAYDAGSMTGFHYSTPAYLNGKVFLWTAAAGVLPAFRNTGTGYKLNILQRKEALQDGYTFVAWTFDPLESLNANLNFGKLGAVCSSYIENYYGYLDDKLNAGLPSDRLLAEWHITSKSATTKTRSELSVDYLDIAIPADIQIIKRRNSSAALRWRLEIRKKLTEAFAGGYAICDFVNNGSKAKTHSYILKKRSILNLDNPPWNN